MSQIVFFGLYDGIIIIDHTKDEVYIAALGIKDNEEKKLYLILKRPLY